MGVVNKTVLNVLNIRVTWMVMYYAVSFSLILFLLFFMMCVYRL